MQSRTMRTILRLICTMGLLGVVYGCGGGGPQGPTSSNPSTPTPPTTPAPTSYGAAAFHEDEFNTYGWSTGYATQSSANNAALNRCGSECTVRGRFEDSCAAYVLYSGGSYFRSSSDYRTSTEAENSTLQECRNEGGENCSTVFAVCSLDRNQRSGGNIAPPPTTL